MKELHNLFVLLKLFSLYFFFNAVEITPFLK